MPCKRIVILGPESTGKSTLCEGLANHFSQSRPSGWVPEYAREYLETHGSNYQFNDLTTIARGQIESEQQAAQKLNLLSIPQKTAAALQQTHDPHTPASTLLPVLFIDTDLYVMKVWSEFVYGQCDTWILDQIASRNYDGYLLCLPDLPWTFDVLREYPDQATRQTLFHIYKDLMINQSTPWAEVSGQDEQRLAGAIASVNEFLSEK